MKPQVFIGSSGKSVEIAKIVADCLNDSGELEACPWPDFFRLGTSFVSSLERAKRCHFGVFVFSKDDLVVSKGNKIDAPRDNVVFEAGLIAGARGFNRLFILLEEGAKLLSDLSGFNVELYTWDLNSKRASRRSDLAKICASIQSQILCDWREDRIRPEIRHLIANLLESSSRAITLGTGLGVDDIRAFCHLHDGKCTLMPVASFMGNRRDSDSEIEVLCDPANPKKDWFIVARAFLNSEFTIANVDWSRARRERVLGATKVVPNLGAVAAHPVLIGGVPCGTVCFDSLKTARQIGWSQREQQDLLKAVLKTVAEIVSKFI